MSRPLPTISLQVTPPPWACLQHQEESERRVRHPLCSWRWCHLFFTTLLLGWMPMAGTTLRGGSSSAVFMGHVWVCPIMPQGSPCCLDAPVLSPTSHLSPVHLPFLIDLFVYIGDYWGNKKRPGKDIHLKLHPRNNKNPHICLSTGV